MRSGLLYNRQFLLRRLTNVDDISGLDSVKRDVNLNVCCNDGCTVFSVNIFTLNGSTFYDCCSFLLQKSGVQFIDTHSKIAAVELT